MSIKYDEYEIKSFFEKEPIYIGDVSSSEFNYSYIDCSIVKHIDMLAKYIFIKRRK